MKSGDVIVDNNDKKWLIFDLSETFIYVVDFDTQKYGEVLLKEDVKEIVELPSNVRSMFLRKRLNNLKGLERFI